MSELDLGAGMMAAPNIRLERVLREGGMGSVWVAEHLGLKTRVAVKFMLLQQSKSEEATTRFSREASAAAQIKSPHVVQVFDHGVNEKGMAYIVMELLEGEDLGTRLQRRGSLPLPEVTAIITQAAKAMSKAHSSGVVHRDIKPDNIFLMDVDGELFVKVLDFGVAKTTVEKAMNMTSTGVMMGTPFYMAPEQMANAKNAVPQSDLWSLAVVAYEALTGKLPFQGETVAGLAIAVERGKFQPPTEVVKGLPKAIDTWFLRVLQREPEKRFNTAREARRRAQPDHEPECASSDAFGADDVADERAHRHGRSAPASPDGDGRDPRWCPQVTEAQYRGRRVRGGSRDPRRPRRIRIEDPRLEPIGSLREHVDTALRADRVRRSDGCRECDHRGADRERDRDGSCRGNGVIHAERDGDVCNVETGRQRSSGAAPGRRRSHLAPAAGPRPSSDAQKPRNLTARAPWRRWCRSRAARRRRLSLLPELCYCRRQYLS